MNLRLPPGLALLFLHLAVALPAAPLSKSQRIDFFRDTNSRDLQGVLTRSDGRVLPGPALSALTTDLDADLLWSFATDQAGNLLVGTGPDGKILQIDPRQTSPTATVVADLPDSHLFALLALPDGSLLAGTSPEGGLILIRDGQALARAKLPATSVLDLALLPSAPGAAPVALVATGNPGRIYRVDLEHFARPAANEETEEQATDEALATRGITLWGRVRDQNLRRLTVLADGRVLAGSAPAGNVYAFPATGGLPVVLAENREAEVTDLLPVTGGFYAAITFAAEPGDARVKRGGEQSNGTKDKPDQPVTDTATLLFSDTAPTPRFRGRSQLVWFPDDGFPEVVMARQQTAFYRLQEYDGLILIAGGEEGELLGYDPVLRRSVTLPGAVAGQLNAILPAHDHPGSFFVLGNNPAALLQLTFGETNPATLTTKRLDLGVPARIGALRFNPGAGTRTDDLRVELRASFSSQEHEGWGEWRQAVPRDGGWSIDGLRGRHVQTRLTMPATPFELPPAEIHFLPQNRRPQLVDFQVLAPDFMLLPAPEHIDPPASTLGQILQSGTNEANLRSQFLASQIVPQTGTQVVYWQINDPDGDNFVSTFSLRHGQADDWTDLAVETTAPYAQFETSHLPEGVYHTRLTVAETAPRPASDRQRTTFSTADILIDRTAPEILDASIDRHDAHWRISVTMRDGLSLPAGLEVNFNHGLKVVVEQPADGILDGNTETFTVEIPLSRATGATAVEVVAFDTLGNSSARRLPLPSR